jgi:hypothetical protein
VKKLTKTPRGALCAMMALTGAIGGLNAQAGPIGRLDVEGGTGNHVDIVAIGIGSRDWFSRSFGEHWRVSSYVLARVAYWGSLDDHPATAAVWDFSVTPVLRLERRADKLIWFAQAGIGIHGLSHTHINDDRTFGSAFQFGEFVGPGVRFGPNGRYELSVLVQHVSNGGIRHANDGLTFGTVVFGYNFQ